MNKWIPGAALAVLCLIAGGMYAVHHGADFVVRENALGDVSAETREMDLTQPDISTEAEPVNINTADAEELDTLPGIGPAKAAAILEYRKSHGYFRVPEDLMKVPGIKEGTYGKLADRITVGELPEIGEKAETPGEASWPGVLLPETELPMRSSDASQTAPAPGPGGSP